MVLRTLETAWQVAQVTPAWATSGSALLPDSRRAGLWQPAHHFAGTSPAPSRVCSYALRYQGFDNPDEAWAEDFHSRRTSGWQPAWPQVSEPRKTRPGSSPPEAV